MPVVHYSVSSSTLFRSLFLALAASACVIPVAPQLSSPLDLSPLIIADEYARVVRIERACNGVPEAAGSGVRIGGSVVLTAYHVVNCDDDDAHASIIVFDTVGMPHAASVEGAADWDVARLDVDGLTDLPPVKVTETSAGHRVCSVFAIPELGRRCGEVWPFSGSKDTSGDLHVDFVGEHGNSGAGTWDDSGNLVGVLVHARPCQGTENDQICMAGITSIGGARRWIASQ